LKYKLNNFFDLVEVTWVWAMQTRRRNALHLRLKKQNEKSSLWKFKVLTSTRIKINQSSTNLVFITNEKVKGKRNWCLRTSRTRN